MNTYQITTALFGEEFQNTVCAETPSKAKYLHYLQSDLFESFSQYLGQVVKCCCIGKTKKQDDYRRYDSFQRTKEYRGMPLVNYGTNVQLGDKKGFIIGSNSSCNFDVKFEDGINNCHPNYEMVYYNDDNTIMYDFRKIKNC